MWLYSEFLNCTLPFIKKGVELPGLLGGSYIIYAYSEHPRWLQGYGNYTWEERYREEHMPFCVLPTIIAYPKWVCEVVWKKKKKKEHLVSGTAWEEIKWNYTGSIQVSITANEQDEESVHFILSSNEGLVYYWKYQNPSKRGQGKPAKKWRVDLNTYIVGNMHTGKSVDKVYTPSGCWARA